MGYRATSLIRNRGVGYLGGDGREVSAARDAVCLGVRLVSRVHHSGFGVLDQAHLRGFPASASAGLEVQDSGFMV